MATDRLRCGLSGGRVHRIAGHDPGDPDVVRYAGQTRVQPPNWIFAPVWTALYLLMAVSAYLVWRPAGTVPPKTPAIAFSVQLALNVLWSIAFFGLRSPVAGLVVIALLVAAIVWMIAVFRRVSPIAAYLQIPYAVWVSFATVLNVSIVVLN